MVLSHISAMTLVHVGYIIEFLWGQRHAPGDSGEGLFSVTYTIYSYYIPDF